MDNTEIENALSIVLAEGQDKSLTIEDLSPYFELPIKEVAKSLNIGLTLLKAKCRELGIPRWPQRKINSLNSMIGYLKELAAEDGVTENVEVRLAIEKLERERNMVMSDPGLQLDEKTRKLRQTTYKASWQKNHGNLPSSSNLLADYLGEEKDEHLSITN